MHNYKYKKSETKSRRVNFLLTPRDRALLEEIVGRAQVSMNEAVAQMIRERGVSLGLVAEVIKY